jgi:hypothetical protein
MIACAVALLVAAGLPARAEAAQPASVPGSASPIKVMRCDPQHNPGSGGGYAVAPGYSPAYYPAQPYYYRGAYNRTYYQPPVSASGSLAIDYVNVTQNTMATIDFGLVAHGRLLAMVRDAGTFSPGAEIKHRFGISPNVFPIGTGLPLCVPLQIRYKDGATWKNPKLPPDNPALDSALSK